MAYKIVRPAGRPIQFPAAPKIPVVPTAGNSWGRQQSAPHKKPFSA